MEDNVLGTVIAIINEEFLLIRAGHPVRISVDDDLLIYGEVESEKLSQAGLKIVRYPKGEVTVVARQENQNFLATIIKTRPQTRTVMKNTLAHLPAFQGIFGTTEEVVVPVPVREKAILDKSSSLNLKMEKIIRIGDKVTKRDSF